MASQLVCIVDASVFMILWCNLFGENEKRQHKRSNGGPFSLDTATQTAAAAVETVVAAAAIAKKVVNVVFCFGALKMKMNVMKETETENSNSYFFGLWTP